MMQKRTNRARTAKNKTGEGRSSAGSSLAAEGGLTLVRDNARAGEPPKLPKSSGKVTKSRKRTTVKLETEYGIRRRDAEGRLAWVADLRRRGQIIKRSFPDRLYGGSEEAFAAARTYRDLVLKAFPPLTTRETAQTMRVNNSSGVTGVQMHKVGGKHLGWVANIKTLHIQGTKIFSFSEHGEKAFELAVAQRQAWVAHMEPEFFTHDPRAKAIAKTEFSELLDQIEIDFSTIAEFAKRVDVLNAAFDAAYPRYVNVKASIREKPGDPLSIYMVVYSAVIGKARHRCVSIQNRPFQEALDLLREKLVETLTTDYGAALSTAFFAAYPKLFTEKHFDKHDGIAARIQINLQALKS